METETIIKNLSDSFGVSSFENNAFPLIKRYVNNISPDLKDRKNRYRLFDCQVR